MRSKIIENITFTGEDVVICNQISNPVRTIDCGSDAIIEIHSITAALLTNPGGCDPTTVIIAITAKKPEHRRSASLSVR